MLLLDLLEEGVDRIPSYLGEVCVGPFRIDVFGQVPHGLGGRAALAFNLVLEPLLCDLFEGAGLDGGKGSINVKRSYLLPCLLDGHDWVLAELLPLRLPLFIEQDGPYPATAAA